MFELLEKRLLAPNINEYVFYAPDVLKNAEPGQFVILRTDEHGERVPFTICGMDKEKGYLTLLVQTVGFTTKKLEAVRIGQSVSDIAGPLGEPTKLTEKNICLVGGGIGSAVIFPQAEHLFNIGNSADVIIGAREKELIMYEDKFLRFAKKLYITTDNGSYVRKGFVTDVLKENIESGIKYDVVFAVGPMPMMRAVCNLTKGYGIKTIVSMNTLMVDGTGMCGCCRLTVGGKTLYACVDGPEFDGHLVDWNEAICRLGTYKEFEHKCNLRSN